MFRLPAAVFLLSYYGKPTATDARGNTSSCSFTVAVTDNRLRLFQHSLLMLQYAREAMPHSMLLPPMHNLTSGSLKKKQLGWYFRERQDLPLRLTGVSKSMDNTEYRAVVKGTCSEGNIRYCRLFVKPQWIFYNSCYRLLDIMAKSIHWYKSALNPSGGNLTWYLNGSVQVLPVFQLKILQ